MRFNYMQSELIFQIEESIEGGYEARALGESIFTEGSDLEEVRANIREAIECHFESENKPSIIRLHFGRDEVFAL